MSNNIIPNEDNNELIAHTRHISKMLYELPALEFEIVMLLNKGLTTDRVVNYILNIIEEEYDKNHYLLNKKINDYSKTELSILIQEFINTKEIKDFLIYLKTKKDNKIYRKAQLDIITFEVYTELLKRIKKGDLKEKMTMTQLVNLSDKLIKALHLEEDRTKEDIKDGLQIVKEYMDIMKINPIIVDDNGFNLYDVEFFGKKTANKNDFIAPDEIENVEHEPE